VTLSQARDAARRLRAERTLGRILPTSVALQKAVEEYLGEIDVRHNTYVYYERNLNRLQGTNLGDVTARDITAILSARKPASRLQCLRTYSAFFNWCIAKHYLDKSPCERMEGGKNKRRTRVLTPDELRVIWTATATPSSYNSIVRLCLVTGQRKTEWAHCRDTWLSYYGVLFPPEVCKNKLHHHFPLGPFAKSLLPSRRGLLFPSDDDTVFSGWSKPKRRLNKSLEIAPWQLRDLRRTYRTIHASIGTSKETAERLVNHISEQGELERIYDQFDYAEPMKKAQLHYETKLAELLGVPLIS
jgi:integrase